MEGVRLEYTPNPGSAIHVNFPIFVGMGMARSDSLKNEHRNFHDGFDNYKRRKNRNEWFIVHPGIQVEANMIRYIKFFAEANYSVAFKTGTLTLPGNTMIGLTFNLGVKIG
ncbi:MAG: hypothetical protein ABIR66_12565 [Saprospiraceae bacterium]